MKATHTAAGGFVLHIVLAVFLYSKRISHIMDDNIYQNDLMVFFLPIIIAILFYMYIFNVSIKSRSSRLGLSLILALGAFFTSLMISVNMFGS